MIVFDKFQFFEQGQTCHEEPPCEKVDSPNYRNSFRIAKVYFGMALPDTEIKSKRPGVAP